MQRHYSGFRALGAEMYGISVDSPAISKRQVVQRLGVAFPILSDESRETIKTYGVHDRIANISKPATFIVDKNGVIQWKEVGEHLADRVFSDTITQQLTRLNALENTPPVISPAIEYVTTKSDQPLTIDLSNHATDNQDTLGNLSWRIGSVDNGLFRTEIVGHQLTIQPIEGTSGTAEIIVTLIDSQGAEVSQTVRVTVIYQPKFAINVPAGVSLFHIPLVPTSVNGESRTVARISDLFELLGGSANVHWLITAQTGGFRVFTHSQTDLDFPANLILRPETGIIASVKQSVQLNFVGEPLVGELHLHPGQNLVGIPHHNAAIRRFSDFARLAEVRDNVTQVAVYSGGQFTAVQLDTLIPGSPNDFEISVGQAFVVTAQRGAVIRFE